MQKKYNSFVKNVLSECIAENMASYKAALTVACLVISAPVVYAQEANEAEESLVLEEVTVSAIRLSVKRALDMKRFDVRVMDGISAQDIADFPDQNLAESIQRVTGVQITRDPNTGRGSRVSLRGLGPSFARTTLNGQALAKPNFADGFSFDIVQPEIASAVQVFKSPSADMDEGGLSGTINIDTLEPLDLDERKIVISGQGIYSEARDETSPKINLAYVDQFMDDRLGVIFNVGHHEVKSRYDIVFNQIYKDYDVNGDGNTPDIGADGEDVKYPRRHRYRRVDMDADRLLFNAGVQYRFSDNLESKINLSYVEEESFNDHNQILLMLRGNPVTPISFTGSHLDYFSVEDHRLELNHTNLNNAEESGAVTWETNWFKGPWQVDGILHYTQSKDIYREQAIVLAVDTVDSVIDYRDPSNPKVTTSVDPADPNTFSEANLARRSYPVTAERDQKATEIAFQIDVRREIEYLPVISAVKFGFKHRKQKMDKKGFSSNNGIFGTDDILDPNNPLPDLPDAYELVEDFGGGAISGLINSWAVPDLDAYARAFNAEGYDVPNYEKNGAFYKFDRNISSAYAMLEFEEEKFRGNVGIRYVNTDREINANLIHFDYIPTDDGLSIQPGDSRVTVVNIPEEYDDVLPSLNLVYDVLDDVVLRASAAKVMVRPEAVSTSYSNKIEFREDEIAEGVHEFRAREGKNGLKAMTAKQFDISAEWYFREASAITLGYFYKDISNQTRTEKICPSSYGGIISGLVEVNTECLDQAGNVWEIEQTYNLDGKLEIKGFELGFTHIFDSLPAPWSGLGMQVNYTKLDATADGEDIALADTSEATGNIIVFYEINNFAARVAYNHREEYNYKGFFGTRVVEDRNQIDISLSYEFNDQMQMSFEGINVNEDDATAYYRNPQEFQGLGTGGATYQLGFKYRL
jgi:TonB-dependent receptor